MPTREANVAAGGIRSRKSKSTAKNNGGKRGKKCPSKYVRDSSDILENVLGCNHYFSGGRVLLSSRPSTMGFDYC